MSRQPPFPPTAGNGMRSPAAGSAIRALPWMSRPLLDFARTPSLTRLAASTLSHSSAVIRRRGQPRCAGHQELQNGSTLHQLARAPGGGGFLPRFLPKQAAGRNRDALSPGHSRKLERASSVRYQPSKLVMRVRFPSPAPVHSQFSIFCSLDCFLDCPSGRQDRRLCHFPCSAVNFESSYVNGSD